MGSSPVSGEAQLPQAPLGQISPLRPRQHGMAIQPGHTLVTSGIYGVIRNPGYLWLLINSLGWGLAFRSGVGVLLTALLIPPLPIPLVINP